MESTWCRQAATFRSRERQSAGTKYLDRSSRKIYARVPKAPRWYTGNAEQRAHTWPAPSACLMGALSATFLQFAAFLCALAHVKTVEKLIFCATARFLSENFTFARDPCPSGSTTP